MAHVCEGALGQHCWRDFFTTEAWTWRGLVTFYTVFVIDFASRRVQILGSTPHPEALFIGGKPSGRWRWPRTRRRQPDRSSFAIETASAAVMCGVNCTRRASVSSLTPERAPNANAYAEWFVRFIKEECLDRLIPLGERHFRTAIAEYVEHYQRERNHQGLENRLQPAIAMAARVRRRPRLGGLLNFYQRAA